MSSSSAPPTTSPSCRRSSPAPKGSTAYSFSTFPPRPSGISSGRCTASTSTSRKRNRVPMTPPGRVRKFARVAAWRRSWTSPCTKRRSMSCRWQSRLPKRWTSSRRGPAAAVLAPTIPAPIRVRAKQRPRPVAASSARITTNPSHFASFSVPWPLPEFPMIATTLDSADSRSSMTPAQRLRVSSAAVRVSFIWLGVRKTLTPSQKTQAAETFGAESDFLSARKKLLDTTHSAYKDVTAIRGRVGAFWKALTLPYPDPGIRLIRQEQVDTFNQQMAAFRQELIDAVACLDEHYAELKSAARCRLGNLYDPLDYPPTLRGLFDLAWEFPNVQPPDYLMQINPAIYEQERARIAARFEEAVRLAEQAFVSEFAGLVSHLCERLSTQGDGEKKVFRDTRKQN